ncbi:hypothetical protein MIND_00958200 [Mycena indigotica]|uniref:Uncharacterized protein n=1 Tax=Mycena indigotica TaxID=2126181 RepID=A0A8H6SEH4_9AGAR|nr:uncharacterized protein MIND_00958200 [Mycena indigotica]KAF7297251.1 hypothetical protein MIND_00958200 [Mycena indigotica]
MSSEIISTTRPSTLAVDSVCAIPGFVHRILEHLGDEGDFDAQDATLRLLSTLGKTHIVPTTAFAMLWHTLHGLKRVINMMPRELFDGNSPRQWKPLLENARVTLADWERPLFYLSHVHELYLNQGPNVLDHFPAYHTDRIFATVRCNNVLLTPNLHTLSWTPPNIIQAERWAPFLHLFVGPSLRTFHMLVDNSLTVRDIFNRLPDNVCAQLTCVILESRSLCVGSTRWTAFSVNRFLGRLRDANHVSTDQLSINDSVLVGLGKLANLTFVQLISMKGQNVPITSDPLFRRLEHLHTIGTDPEHVAELLPVIWSHALEVVSVNFLLGTGKSYELLLEALPHLPAPENVKEICINDFDPVTYHAIGRRRSLEEFFAAAKDLVSHTTAKPGDYTIAATCLRALAEFSNLTRLFLVLPLGFAGLTDTLLDEVTKNWPSLQSMSLLPQVSFPLDLHRPFPIELTLDAFITIATNCRNLHTLGLVIDASAPLSEELCQRALAAPVCPQLFHIEVLDSPIQSPHPVARFLASLFPRLRVIHAGADVPLACGPMAALSDYFERTWYSVQVALPEMAEIWARVPGKSWKDIKVVVDDDDLRWFEEETDSEVDVEEDW